MVRGLRNRERIAHAAWELFWEKGYHATSVGDIASAARVPKGSIYNYYNSKEQLLGDVAGRLRYAYETELRLEVLGGTMAPGELVKRLLQHYREVYQQYGYGRGDPLASRLDELADSHLDLAARLVSIQSVWREVVTQKIWAYATVASIPALIERADALAAMIQAALQGVLLQMKAVHSADPLEEAERTLVPMVTSYVAALATGDVPVDS